MFGTSIETKTAIHIQATDNTASAQPLPPYK
jgi:hypothetical protein